MAALFRGRTVMGRSRAALGYYEGRVVTPTPFLQEGERLVGHCYHWSTVEDRADDAVALSVWKNGEEPKPDGRVHKAAFASYLHVHFASRPSLPRNFVRACRCHREEVAP